MLQIDAILPLYADDAARHSLLTDALEYVRSDLLELHRKIESEDYEAALHQVHRAKGTASFLGGDNPALKYFDQLTNAIKHAKNNKRSLSEAPISVALTHVESMMNALTTSLEKSISHYKI